MMFPASTCWPPKRLTPSRFDSESRPFFELPPAFLCAMSLLLACAADARDLDFRERLTMTEDALVVLAAPELDDRDLVFSALRYDLRLDLAALQQRRADLDLGAFADEQDVLERDGVADGGVELLDADTLALTGAVLLTASPENGIHDELLLGEILGRGPGKGWQF